ncbi:MAG: sterol carrier protein [Firmicutes bacterium]|nr:sterol carrier protein [Alicyclobacillaceae bacterium]MCL6497147.1 sterol carrier protein [Bacillota bacterium]
MLRAFCAACNQNPKLVAMNRDWERLVAILSPEGDRHWIRCQAGRLSWQPDEGGREPDLEVEAPRAILEAVFAGRMAPTDPYNRGDLLVRGQADDLLRLDIITLMVWGE